MSDVNPCFSEDIWFEILKNLPVKSLGKCRCVCKSWHSLIVSPSFMAAHLKHYTQNEANSLILCREISKRSRNEKFEQCIFFRDVLQLKLGNRLHISICPFVIPRSWLSSGFYFVGSVNGLLCISDNGHVDRILIWNPLIQKSIKLPKSGSEGDSMDVGFGYDGRRNDHRVVKISLWPTKMEYLVEVYSVQERTWKTICAKYLVDNSMHPASGSHCFVNGAIHWRARDKWMLLFNVSEETFAKMALPEELVNEMSRRRVGDFGLFEYKGKLSVSNCETMSRDLNVSARCQIWVKLDYNVDSSWYKILFVEMLPKFYSIGTFEYLGDNEELIGFAKEGSRELVSYDHKTKQITDLGLYGISDSTKFRAFSESLTLIDQKIDDLTADELGRPVDNTPSNRQYLEYFFGDPMFALGLDFILDR
ncbi:F-box/kelch-repeat protein At3g06240-like [Silene latifolia]|uniref:F-box/kelch-repeat protein At3g06240-like n=1 Tax=Silene latifolia TaxID=37657 RepID=UPI003D787933